MRRKLFGIFINAIPVSSVTLTSYYKWKGDTKTVFLINAPQSINSSVKFDESSKVLNVEFVNYTSDKESYMKIVQNAIKTLQDI